MITGTHYFVSFDAAMKYYLPYCPHMTPEEISEYVKNKLDEGLIAIACPYEPEKLHYLDSQEGRYYFME